MNYADPELRDRLAAEYALGALRGLDRRRFERLLSGDRDLRDLVEAWELRLNLLAESAPAVEPRAHVWDEIARQIAPVPAPVREGWLDRLWDSLGFWRAAAALAAATAAVLACYVAFLPPRVGPDRSRRSTNGSHASRTQPGAWWACRARSPLSATAWPASRAGSMRWPPGRRT